MPKITFNKNHDSEHLRFWTWRDYNRKLAISKAYDDEQAKMFAERAGELREEVEFLLGGGLSQGAETALNSLAEEDMADFCILVDLAEPLAIPGVEPLEDETRKHLHRFLDAEPWHSLVVDNDITVALALLDSVGSMRTNRPWYDYAPHLVEVIARVLDNGNTEQLKRFVGEYNTLADRDHLHLPDEVPQIFETLVHNACQQHGIAMLPVTR